ncbi:dTDP-4-dehydrorhamnose reductase [Cognatishimia sp. F0-27]|uniref:dTDP-4-dehydrorhamnose reductase n=1 Tax=Cognatishimia sp. F0-27 TaxID=2816855 RepID=UPI001D0CB28E|nr:dTDP-4-dehydrorhamnose reductase [Cognatishimia sp. F0-27]MCC1495056.1 dTDP-4-dehydrorhamnose reductase [Cognatishimia sp. F0-27]
MTSPLKTLVFGTTGQVARELALTRPDHVALTALSRADADLALPEICAEAIATHAPDLVINAAAYTAVDRAEEEPREATLINAEAPAAMAEICATRGIPFCHVSTDYVFDGTGTQAWHPSDRAAPLGVYGRTKWEGEEAVRAAGGPHAILRTSWVFSAHGSNFVKTMLRLSESRDTLSVVADQIGGPTPARDIARALWALGASLRTGGPSGTYHFAGQPAVSWADFARAIFARAGKPVTVTDIPSTDYPTPARRPANSRLDGTTLARDHGIAQPDWQAGLDAVLATLAAPPDRDPA